MIKKITIVVSAVIAIIVLTFTEGSTNQGGAPAGTTGAPSEGSCANAGCHSAVVNSGTGVTTLTFNTGTTSYKADSTYTVTLKHVETGRSLFGFIATSLNSSNVKSGNIAVSQSTRTKISTAGGRQYITHNASGTTPVSNNGEWQFRWTAPSAGAGAVTFYAAINAANGNGNTGGDRIYTRSFVFTEDVNTGLQSVTNTSDINIYPNPIVSDAQVTFTTSAIGMTQVSIYDMQGKMVKNIFSSSLTAGTHIIGISANDLVAGLYFLSIETAQNKLVKQFIVTK